jgi:hypothetical protein
VQKQQLNLVSPTLLPLESWKAVTSKADPRQRQDWILKCLQDERSHPLAVCGVLPLCWNRAPE